MVIDIRWRSQRNQFIVCQCMCSACGMYFILPSWLFTLYNIVDRVKSSVYEVNANSYNNIYTVSYFVISLYREHKRDLNFDVNRSLRMYIFCSHNFSYSYNYVLYTFVTAIYFKMYLLQKYNHFFHSLSKNTKSYGRYMTLLSNNYLFIGLRLK